MEYQNLRFEKKSGIGYLTLNRPDKLNALSAELMAELRHALDLIEEEAEVKVVILTGAGAHFSAGADIADSLRHRAASTDHPVQRGAG